MLRRRARLRWLTQLRRSVVAVLALFLSSSSQAARPPADGKHGEVSVADRLDALSEKLRAAREDATPAPRGFRRIGQWVNWPNWNNWPNWPNWRNYWPNWPNY